MEMYCRFGGTCCRHLQVRKERGTNSTVYQHWVRKMGLLRCGAVEFGRQLLVFQKKTMGIHLPSGWGRCSFCTSVNVNQVTCRQIPWDSVFHKYAVRIESGKIQTHIPGKVSWQEVKLGVIDSSRFLSTIVVNLYQYKVTRPVVRRSQEAAIHPLQIWMHLLGFSKISKTNFLIGQMKNMPRPTASACCHCWPPRLETTSF
jgi:hypothetical protein